MCVWGSMPPVQKYISDMQLKLKLKAIMLQGKKTHQCTLRFNFKQLKKKK